MKQDLAFVGDIHGNIRALRGIVMALEGRRLKTVVFLGDYVNKGPDSALVIEYLKQRHSGGGVVALRGNHEEAFLDALRTGDLRPLLRMGGAPTVRAYVGRDVRPDVAADLKASVPEAHVSFLESMPREFKASEIIATHAPSRQPQGRFAVSAHRQVGLLPLIGPNRADIDTGCGTPGGRLTAFLWPSRGFVQVDECGRLLRQ